MDDSNENSTENNNVHPNSRAARGDAAIEAERAARDAALPAQPAANDDSDKDAKIAELEASVESLTADKDALETELAEHKDAAGKDGETAATELKAAQDEVASEKDRADKAEAKVQELTDQLAEAQKPAEDPKTGDEPTTPAPEK